MTTRTTSLAPSAERARWRRPGLALVGLLLVGANLRAGITAVGPVLGDVRADLHLSGTTASVLVSIPLLAFAVVSPAAPALAARLGLERALAAALAVLAAAIVVRSLPEEPALWIGTVALGVAVAVLNVVLPALVKRDHPGDVGRMTGAYSSVQSGAAAVASGIAVPLAGTAEGGWRVSLGVWAGLALVGLAVFAPRLRRPAPSQAAAGTAAGPRPPALAAPPVTRSPWGTALGWQVTLFMGLQSTVYYTLITWWPSIERAHGVDAAEAGWHLFALQAASIAGNLATAALLHRSRDQRPLAVAVTALVGAGVVGQLLAPSASLLWMLVAGTGVGGAIVLALSLFGLRTRDHRQAAALSGMAQSVGYVMAAAGPVVIGLLHDAAGTWTPALLVLTALLAVQLLAGLGAGRRRRLPAQRGATTGGS